MENVFFIKAPGILWYDPSHSEGGKKSQLFAKGKVIIGEYSPRQSWGEYSQ